jgi:hypothetical protein
MRITNQQLRRIIREELTLHAEGRSNTFMASHMEEEGIDEQDRDGDGDSDFDDVRVARFTAGGMDKKHAVARVKRHPLGHKGSKKN